MRIEFLICPLVVSTTMAAVAEPLEKRFGSDRERGYRMERGLNAVRPGFENRDRSHFLDIDQPPNDQSRRPAAIFIPPCPSPCGDS